MRIIHVPNISVTTKEFQPRLWRRVQGNAQCTHSTVPTNLMLMKDLGKEFLKAVTSTPQSSAGLPQTEALSSFFPKRIFQERLFYYKSPFWTHNSEHDKWDLFPLKDWLIFKPWDNFYFKYLLFFNYKFNLPFNLFKGFDHAAEWDMSFFQLILGLRITPLKFLQCALPPFGFDLIVFL